VALEYVTPAGIRRLTDAVERLRLAEARLGRQRAGDAGLNDADRAAIRYLVEQGDSGVPVTPSLLAARLHMSPSAVTALVDRLVAKGMVSLQPHPTDRRSKVVVAFDRTIDPDQIDPLTQRLRTLSARLSPRDADLIAEFLEDVTEAVTAQHPRMPLGRS
jgi:DNA-binding MarR family transcriptional regulator